MRNGSVVDLQVGPGRVTALVSGSTMYDVKVTVGPVPRARWSAICEDCSGAIDSLVELLQGRFSKGVMARLCEQKTGLFPSPKDIIFTCSCPDWASMCKHVAAVLYGIGARLDHQPELLFTLRKVDQQDLIATGGGRSREEGQATSRREGARERRSLGDVRHRDGAGDTGEAASQRGSARGHRPRSQLPCRPNRRGVPRRRSRRRLRPTSGGGGRRLTLKKRQAIAERMRMYWAERRADSRRRKASESRVNQPWRSGSDSRERPT